MKQITLLFLVIALLSILAACGGKTDTSSSEPPAQTKTDAPAQTAAPTPPTQTVLASEAAAPVSGNGTLVVYFSRVGNTDFPEDTDAVSGATLSRVDGALKGNAQREMITFCFLAAQGGCEPQLTSHAVGNMRVGNDKVFLIRVISQCLPYIGYPRSLNALRCVNEAAKQFESK